MMQKLVIMQGPPGGGKTTVAIALKARLESTKEWPGSVQICSTDDYFMIGHPLTGFYKFEPDKLTKHHQSNQHRVLYLLERGITVIVDNTNIRAWEARPYVEMGMRLQNGLRRGLKIEFVRCDGRFPNTHGVPGEKVEAMRAAMEDLSVEACLAAKYPWEEEKAECSECRSTSEDSPRRVTTQVPDSGDSNTTSPSATSATPKTP